MNMNTIPRMTPRKNPPTRSSKVNDGSAKNVLINRMIKQAMPRKKTATPIFPSQFTAYPP